MSRTVNFNEIQSQCPCRQIAQDDFEYESEDDYHFRNRIAKEFFNEGNNTLASNHNEVCHNGFVDCGIEYEEYRKEKHHMSTISREHIVFWANKLGMNPDELNELANPKLISTVEYRKVKAINPAMRKTKKKCTESQPLLQLLLKAYNDPGTKHLFDQILTVSDARRPEHTHVEVEPSTSSSKCISNEAPKQNARAYANVFNAERKMLKVMDEICKLIGLQHGLERECAERGWADVEQIAEDDERQPGGHNELNAAAVAGTSQGSTCQCNERSQSPQVQNQTYPQFANEQQQQLQAQPAVPQMPQAMLPSAQYQESQFCPAMATTNIYKCETLPVQPQTQVCQNAAQSEDQSTTAPKSQTESKRIPLLVENVTDYALEYTEEFIKEEAQTIVITHLDENNGIVKASSHSCNTPRRAQCSKTAVDKDKTAKKPTPPKTTPPEKPPQQLPNKDVKPQINCIDIKKSKLECYKEVAQQQHRKLEYLKCQIEELKQLQTASFARNAQQQQKKAVEDTICPAQQGKPCVSFQLPPTVHNLPSQTKTVCTNEGRNAIGDRKVKEKQKEKENEKVKEKECQQSNQAKKPVKMPPSCLISKQSIPAQFNFKNSPQTQQADRNTMQNELQKMLQDQMQHYSKYAPSNIIDQKSNKK